MDGACPHPPGSAFPRIGYEDGVHFMFHQGQPGCPRNELMVQGAHVYNAMIADQRILKGESLVVFNVLPAGTIYAVHVRHVDFAPRRLELGYLRDCLMRFLQADRSADTSYFAAVMGFETPEAPAPVYLYDVPGGVPIPSALAADLPEPVFEPLAECWSNKPAPYLGA